MRGPSVTTLLLFSGLFALVSNRNVPIEICQTKECLFAAQNLKESIDFAADPCEDFYKYACGNWKNISKNSNNHSDVFNILKHERIAEIRGFLIQNNTNYEPEAVHKARQYFSLCKNTAAYKNTTDQILDIQRKWGIPLNWSSFNGTENFDYTTALAKVASFVGTGLYFNLGVNPNPYNRIVNTMTLFSSAPIIQFPTREKTAAESVSHYELMTEKIRSGCLDSATGFCNDSTIKENGINKTITHFQKLGHQQIERTLPSAWLIDREIPTIYTLKQLQELTDGIAEEVNTKIPKLNWTRFIEATFTGLDNVTLNLSDPNKVQIFIYKIDSLKETARIFYQLESVEQLVFVLKSILLAASPLVNYNSVDSLQREQSCFESTVVSFGMALSYVYTTKENYIDAKATVSEMFEHIRDTFTQVIQKAHWMDDETRQKALKKISSVRAHIAYPEMLKSPAKLNDLFKHVQISDNFFDTVVSIIQHDRKKYSSELNRINNLNEDWNMKIPPYIANAFYLKNTNAMVIPAGVLRIPMYNNGLRALDYGAIGSIVGHELTHALDITGLHYNEIGNLENWWKQETLKAYLAKAACFSRAYHNYSTDFRNVTQKIDSNVTLGEDIADNGGFHEALFAYRNISDFGKEPILPQFENFTGEQLFTLSFANIWCENPTMEKAAEKAQIDNHSPNGVRVNGVLSNSEDFAEIWKCSKGSKMNPNTEKCTLW